MELAKESDEKTESQVFSWGEAEPSPLRFPSQWRGAFLAGGEVLS